MGDEGQRRRAAGEHARAKAKSLRWRRFLGGNFERDYGTWSRGAEGIFLDHLDPKMVSQAYAEKKKLEEITFMEVDPLLVFSRAYIVGPVPARRRGVLIMPARMLAGHLARRQPVLSVERAEVIHRRLALAVGQAADAG